MHREQMMAKNFLTRGICRFRLHKSLFTVGFLLWLLASGAALAGNALFSEPVDIAGHGTVEVVLASGNDKYGYTHIKKRHVVGTITNPGGITSFFPAGYEVRPGVMTPPLMSEEDIINLIAEAAASGSQSPQGSRVVVDYNPNAFGISSLKVVIDLSDGDIITAYPTDGPSVCVYSDKNHRVEGGDCR